MSAFRHPMWLLCQYLIPQTQLRESVRVRRNWAAVNNNSATFQGMTGLGFWATVVLCCRVPISCSFCHWQRDLWAGSNTDSFYCAKINLREHVCGEGLHQSWHSINTRRQKVKSNCNRIDFWHWLDVFKMINSSLIVKFRSNIFIFDPDSYLEECYGISAGQYRFVYGTLSQHLFLITFAILSSLVCHLFHVACNWC